MMKKNLFKSHFNDESGKVNRAKFIHGRVKIVEKFLPELGKTFSEYIDKTAKGRDCGDRIAVVLEEYAKAENVTSAFKLQISDFAAILLDVGTARDAQVQAMETKILEQLSDYDKLCKAVQGELKLTLAASDKEKHWARQLKRMRESQPHDPQQISVAEAECLKAKGESSRLSRSLEEQIDIFERKRLNAVKEALLAWTLSELHFHSKALQLFTDAFRTAADIDVHSDVEEFRMKLRCTEDPPRSDSLPRSDSILQLISLPFQRKMNFSGNGIPHPSSDRSSLHSSPSASVSFLLRLFSHYSGLRIERSPKSGSRYKEPAAFNKILLFCKMYWLHCYHSSGGLHP